MGASAAPLGQMLQPLGSAQKRSRWWPGTRPLGPPAASTASASARALSALARAARDFSKRNSMAG